MESLFNRCGSGRWFGGGGSWSNGRCCCWRSGRATNVFAENGAEVRMSFGKFGKLANEAIHCWLHTLIGIIHLGYLLSQQGQGIATATGFEIEKPGEASRHDQKRDAQGLDLRPQFAQLR